MNIISKKHSLVVSMCVVSWSMVASVSAGTAAKLVNVAMLNPEISFDLRYATTKNFTRSVIVNDPVCLLDEKAAQSLDAIARDLKEIGLGIKIFEGYRSMSDHKKMSLFMEGSDECSMRHMTGLSVDLTLIDLEDGSELIMPCEYDQDCPAASRNYNKSSAEAFMNSLLLEELMVEQGWEPEESAWWHFDYKGWQNSDYLDVPCK